MLSADLLLTAVMPSAFTRGLVLGAGVTSIIAAVVVLTLQVTGTAPAMMGGQGEQWTASELRPLRRQGWRVVNNVSLRNWDIDHVLIGPGGAFAIETKWTSKPWVLEPAERRIVDAAEQAARNARDLRLWAPFRTAGIEVRPVVMLWGGDLPSSRRPKRILEHDGVVVVPGPQASLWRKDLQQDALSPAQIEAGWLALDEQVRLRDERDLEPVPRSVENIANTTLATVVSAVAGVVTAAWLLELAGAAWVWAGAGACGTVALLVHPLRRYELVRLPCLGWQAGVLGTLLAAGLGAAVTQVS